MVFFIIPLVLALVFQNVTIGVVYLNAAQLTESLKFKKGNKKMKLEKNMKNVYQKRLYYNPFVEENQGALF